MSPNSLKLLAAATSLLVPAVVLLPRSEACAGTDPNITRVQQFIWKPAPGDLLLKPKPKKHPKSQLKDADN